MKFNAQEKPRQPQDPEKWVVLKEWAGKRGRIETDKFKTATTWRVSWKATTGDPDPIGSISISVRKATGELVKMANNLGQKSSSGRLSMLAAGEYYLEIESADRNWVIAVEQASR